MKTLKFTDMDRIRTLVEHAQSCTEWGMGYEDDVTPEPGFYFVKDQGIYLMSNGIPKMPHEDGANVVYAKGYDPSANEDWWDDCSNAVGGDDFVEVLQFAPNLLPIPEGAVAFVIKVSATRLECGWDVKTTRAKVKA